VGQTRWNRSSRLQEGPVPSVCSKKIHTQVYQKWRRKQQKVEEQRLLLFKWTVNTAKGCWNLSIKNSELRDRQLVCHVTIIINEEDYNLKINSVLGEFPYKSIANEPSNIYEKSVKSVNQQLLNSNTITKNIHNWLNIQNSRCPWLYDAPKFINSISNCALLLISEGLLDTILPAMYVKFCTRSQEKMNIP